MSNNERKGEYVALRMTGMELQRIVDIQADLKERFGVDFSQSQTVRFLIRLGLGVNKKYHGMKPEEIPVSELVEVAKTAIAEEAKDDGE